MDHLSSCQTVNKQIMNLTRFAGEYPILTRDYMIIDLHYNKNRIGVMPILSYRL